MTNLFTFDGPMIARIQLSAAYFSALAAPFADFTMLHVIMTIVIFYAFSSIGVSMMMHRYWSHKSFEFKNPIVKWACTAIALISARGSPLAWVHIHRQHHANSDTEKDPHKPGKFRLLSFKSTYISELKVFLIKDLMTKEHKFMHEYYLVFILLWIVFLAAINPQLVLFAWALPVFLNQISQDLWNYFSHVDVGYRNFETRDNSRNVPFLWPLILGEAWHNNHHHNARVSTRVMSWEYDPIDVLIGLIKK